MNSTKIEPTAGAGKTETTGEDFGEVGSRYDNGGDILCGGGASGASICVREVGNDPSAGDVPQGFPPLGGTTDGGNDTQMSTGWVHLCPIPLVFGYHSHHLSYRPVVETLEGHIHMRGHYPLL